MSDISFEDFEFEEYSDTQESSNGDTFSESNSESSVNPDSGSDSDSDSDSGVNAIPLGADFEAPSDPKLPSVEEPKSTQEVVEEKATPLKKPYVGQQFMSLEEARDFYFKYARNEGFGVRVRDSRKEKARDNMVTRVIFCCDREGRHVKKLKPNDPDKPVIRRNTSTQKCGCLARFRVVMDKGGKWIVNLFLEVHNHKPVTPVKQVCMKGRRFFPNVARDLVYSFRDINLPVGKVVTLLDGNVIGFDERDCYNHLGTKKAHKTPIEGDATAMENFFSKRQAEDPQFFYAIQTDKDSRAINFLWIDGRSRSQYQY